MSVSPSLPSWSVRAVNLPEHADNPVHTVAGARAAGFPGAVVAGTTVYAYLTRPAAAAWGDGWVVDGSAEVRFVAPVFDGDLVEVVPVRAGDGWMVEAHTPGGLRASCAVALGGDIPGAPLGDRLEPLVEVIDERWAGYARRAHEDLPLYEDVRLVHPVVWLALANRVFARQLVAGPWVHTRSRVRHLGGAAPGATAVVEAWVVDRFTTRSGDRVVADVRVTIDGRLVASIEHEAIVRLAEVEPGEMSLRAE